MATSFKIDAEKGIAYIDRSGELTIEELTDVVDRLSESPGYGNISKLLSDLTQSSVGKISSSEVALHAQRCSEKWADMSLKVALVASGELHHGFSKTFVKHLKLDEIKVFANRELALEWLDSVLSVTMLNFDQAV